MKMLAKSGATCSVLFSTIAIECEGEAHAIATVIDVTERTQAEAEVRALNAELEQRVSERTAQLAAANLAKDRFLASMSHELRTPLNAILGFTGTLLMKLPGALTAEQDKQLRIIQSSAQHLLSLINDILDLAKIEAGKVELRREPLVCQQVIAEVVTILRSLADAKGLALETEMLSEDVVLSTDRRALSQILINLVNNAITFTEQGSVRLSLGYAHEQDRHLVEIRVADTGRGIRPEDQARLFQLFSQIDREQLVISIP